jgi:hypothetical protein
LISGPVNDPDNQKRGRKRGGELVVRTKVLQSLCLEELFYASTLPESTSDVQVCNNDPVVQFSYTIHNTEERERPGRRDTSVDRHSSLIYEFSNQQGYSTTNKISKKNQLSVFRVQTAVQTRFRFRELKVDTYFSFSKVPLSRLALPFSQLQFFLTFARHLSCLSRKTETMKSQAFWLAVQPWGKTETCLIYRFHIKFKAYV